MIEFFLRFIDTLLSFTKLVNRNTAVLVDGLNAIHLLDCGKVELTSVEGILRAIIQVIHAQLTQSGYVGGGRIEAHDRSRFVDHSLVARSEARDHRAAGGFSVGIVGNKVASIRSMRRVWQPIPGVDCKNSVFRGVILNPIHGFFIGSSHEFTEGFDLTKPVKGSNNRQKQHHPF